MPWYLDLVGGRSIKSQPWTGTFWVDRAWFRHGQPFRRVPVAFPKNGGIPGPFPIQNNGPTRSGLHPEVLMAGAESGSAVPAYGDVDASPWIAHGVGLTRLFERTGLAPWIASCSMERLNAREGAKEASSVAPWGR